MALISPRAGQGNRISQAASVPEEWEDEVEHRRKLAEAIRLLADYLQGLNLGAGFDSGFDTGFG